MKHNEKDFRTSFDQDTEDNLRGLGSVAIGLLYGVVMSILSFVMLVFYVLKVFIDSPWVDIGAPVIAGAILLYLIGDIVYSIIFACRVKGNWGTVAFNTIYWLSFIWLPIVLLGLDLLFWIF